MLPIYPPKHLQVSEFPTEGLHGVFGDKLVVLQQPVRCDALITDDYTTAIQEYQLSGVPVGVRYPWIDERIWFGDSVPRLPYVGRTYHYGAHDCLSLVRDWYANEKKILFADTMREFEWWLKGSSMEEGYLERGFSPVEEPRVGDVVLFYCPELDIPTHVGIYLEDAQILHHLMDRASEITRLSVLRRSGFRVCAYLRHEWDN